VAFTDKRVLVYDLETKDVIREFPLDYPVYNLTFTKNEQILGMTEK